MPASIIRRMTSGLSEAGPMVQTILVFLMVGGFSTSAPSSQAFYFKVSPSHPSRLSRSE